MPETREQELQQKVSSLVERRFGGNYETAFRHYTDHNGASAITRDRLARLLKDADVGNGLNRGAWVDGILARLDANRDGLISQREFEGMIRKRP